MARQEAKELASEIVAQYESLTLSAETCLGFQLRELLPDLTEVGNWKWLRREIYLFYSPMSSLHATFAKDGPNDTGPDRLRWTLSVLWRIVRLLGWFYLITVWNDLLGFAFLQVMDPIAREVQSAPPVGLEGVYIFVLAVILVIFFPVTAYCRVVELIRDTRYSRNWRAILFTGLCAWIFLIPWQFLTQSEQNALISLYRDGDILWLQIYVAFAIVFAGIPALIALYLAFVDIAPHAFSILLNMMQSIREMINPRTSDFIGDFLANAVSDEAEHKLYLYDLDMQTLTTLGRWAELNREGANLKTLPLAIFFATGSILFSVESVQRQLQAWLNWFEEGIRLLLLQNAFTESITEVGRFQTYFRLNGIILSIMVLILLWKSVADLFQTIAVQSLVVEACEVAKHIRNRLDLEIEQELTLSPPAMVAMDRRGFVGRLVDRVLGS